jgi:hypothetical protein
MYAKHSDSPKGIESGIIAQLTQKVTYRNKET